MTMGKKTWLIIAIWITLTRFCLILLESLDRLIAMNLLEVYETEEGLVPICILLEQINFFYNVAFYQKLLEKK